MARRDYSHVWNIIVYVAFAIAVLAVVYVAAHYTYLHTGPSL